MNGVILYLPVIHQGYLRFLQSYPQHEILILDEGIMEAYTPMTRDLRKISSNTAAKILQNLGHNAHIVSKERLASWNTPNARLILPNESEMHDLAQKLFPQAQTTFVNTFLRWDKTLTTTETMIAPDRTITSEQFHQEMLKVATRTAEQSADWWRQVGAALVKDGQIIAAAHNKHLPTDYHLAQNGDPRVNVDAGQRPDLYSSIHAEATIIATAARQGQSTQGADIYVTTFPCPNCARLISEAGIRTVYYEKGFSRLDGEEILRAFNVNIVLVTPPDTALPL